MFQPPPLIPIVKRCFHHQFIYSSLVLGSIWRQTIRHQFTFVGLVGMGSSPSMRRQADPGSVYTTRAGVWQGACISLKDVEIRFKAHCKHNIYHLTFPLQTGEFPIPLYCIVTLVGVSFILPPQHSPRGDLLTASSSLLSTLNTLASWLFWALDLPNQALCPQPPHPYSQRRNCWAARHWLCKLGCVSRRYICCLSFKSVEYRHLTTPNTAVEQSRYCNNQRMPNNTEHQLCG